MLMLVAMVIARRNASRCRKQPWLMISLTAAVSAGIPSAASRSQPVSSSAGMAVTFMMMPLEKEKEAGRKEGPGAAGRSL